MHYGTQLWGLLHEKLGGSHLPLKESLRSPGPYVWLPSPTISHKMFPSITQISN